jgi:hypothetical protein
MAFAATLVLLSPARVLASEAPVNLVPQEASSASEISSGGEKGRHHGRFDRSAYVRKLLRRKGVLERRVDLMRGALRSEKVTPGRRAQTLRRSSRASDSRRLLRRLEARAEESKARQGGGLRAGSGSRSGRKARASDAGHRKGRGRASSGKGSRSRGHSGARQSGKSRARQR